MPNNRLPTHTHTFHSYICLHVIIFPHAGQGSIDLTDPSVVQSQVFYEATSLLHNSTIPLPASISNSMTSRANLILASNVFTPGLSYTFRLTALTNQGQAYSQVTFTPSAPPQLTNLLVAPTSGVALETVFELEAVNTVDNPNVSPFLYVFGIVDSNVDASTMSVSDHAITWLSAVQPSAKLSVILPTPPSTSSSKVTLLVRIFNRNGGSSDSLAVVDVLTNSNLINEASFTTIVSDVNNHLLNTKDWDDTLSRLIAITLELNSQQLTHSNIRSQILDIFENVFNNYLPSSVTNYQLAASLLRHLTRNGGLSGTTEQARVATITRSILQWFDSQLDFQQSSDSIPSQNTGEPLYLQSSYTKGERGFLTDSLAMNLLSPFTNLIAMSPTSELFREYVQNIDLMTRLLCKEKSTGQDASELDTEFSKIYGSIAQPRGSFNVSGVIVNFQDALADLFQTQACSQDNSPCLETCVSGASFESDYLGSIDSQILSLENDTIGMLMSEIEGSDPQNVEIFSSVISASIFIPSRNSYPEASSLNSNIQITVPLKESVPNGSQPLCLYREVGGGNGFDSIKWQLDSVRSPEIITLSGTTHAVCEFNHLTEFVIGLLPPPVIPPPPTTTPPPTTAEPTTEPTTPTTPPTTEATTIPPESVPFPAAAVAIVIVLLLLIIAAIVITLVSLFLWKKKRSKKLQISPATEDTDGGTEDARLNKAGPLTPEESKVPMQIILCADSGDRKLIGKMNVLPSIRLRELRYQLADNFDMFKNKPFYFLTRQLCDIEPAAEQQQFVSLVFGDKPIFVREVSAENEMTKKHFCVCGNAAQFECSNCSSQGYCSPECQLKHWGEQHQRQCSRLSEKRRRSDVLSSRQGQSVATSPVGQRPQGFPGRTRRVTLGTYPSVDSKAISPTTPTDWKGFMNAGKSFQQQPETPVSPQRSASVVMPPKPTLGELARPSLSQQTSPRSPPTLGPLSIVTTPSHTLPPLSRSANLQGYPQFFSRPSYQTPTPGAMARTIATNMYGTTSTAPPTSLQPPIRSQPDLFTKTDPVEQSTIQPRHFERKISITSVESEDLAFSMNVPRDLRYEPLLESDEEDYETSSSSSASSPKLLEAPPTATPTPKILVESDTPQESATPPEDSVEPNTETGAPVPANKLERPTDTPTEQPGGKEGDNGKETVDVETA